MPNSVITLTKWNGLNLALDPRQHTAPTLLAGQNVLVDAEGVFSAFGADFVSEAIIADEEKAQTFRLGLATVIFAGAVVYKFDQTSQRYYPVFSFTDTNDYDYPWTQARVGTSYQFAKYGVGLIRHIPSSDDWQVLSGGSIPSDIRFVTQCGGRLIAVTGTAVAWTAIDDCTDFTTSVDTGAGAQSLAVIGKGAPLGVKTTKNGFIVFTETGAAFFQLVNATIPFRFTPIETEELPINPWCMISIGLNRVVYLAEQGFRMINAGGEPEPWEPIMGEYLSKKVLPRLDLSSGLLVALHYSAKNQWFIVSFGNPSAPHRYELSYVLYMANMQWGVFNEPHHQFGELYLESGVNAGFNFGFFCDQGFFRRFSPYARRETTRQTGETVYSQLQFDPPMRISNTTLQASTFARGMGMDFSGLLDMAGVFDRWGDFATFPIDPANTNYVDETPYGAPTFEDWNAITGTEDWNAMLGTEDWGSGDLVSAFLASGVGWIIADLYYWSPTDPVYGSIRSIAEVGLVKFTDGQYGDTLSEINAVTIGSNARVQFTFVDWLEIDGLHDWGSETGEEDWGGDFPVANDFALIFTGTLDGISVFNDNEKTPDPAVEAENAVFYNFNLKGIYHRFRLTALENNSFFHLKTADITGSLAGRL